KARNEKKVVEGLLAVGIEAYTPLAIQHKQWKDRIKKIETPILTSYVFVCLLEKDMQKVFDVPGIVRYVYWLKSPAVIKDEEIQALKDSLREPIYDFAVEQITLGMSLMVEEGPFSGQEGTVIQISSNRIQLSLESLNVKLIIQRNKI
ncbi:transcription termination/antitermination NusG family protein, partial [Arthrospira platensis SPKY1]|nr:transcription termination/antitermination NusG family protein [Arthrospira platensis SPKY1]